METAKKQVFPKGKLFLKFVVPATVDIAYFAFFSLVLEKLEAQTPGQGNMIKSFF